MNQEKKIYSHSVILERTKLKIVTNALIKHANKMRAVKERTKDSGTGVIPEHETNKKIHIFSGKGYINMEKLQNTGSIGNIEWILRIIAIWIHGKVYSPGELLSNDRAVWRKHTGIFHIRKRIHELHYSLLNNIQKCNKTGAGNGNNRIPAPVRNAIMGSVYIHHLFKINIHNNKHRNSVYILDIYI